MAPFWKLSVAGFAATAITYGPARMGFGLFLSEFRADFALSTGMAGLISSLGFLGMLLGEWHLIRVLQLKSPPSRAAMEKRVERCVDLFRRGAMADRAE